jgi:predicted transcriptional regulator
MNLVVKSDGFEGYAKRALERARRLERGEALQPEITIVFDDPLAMVEVLTAERLRLVQRIRRKSSSISALAAALKRDPKSVRRDVAKLERAGVVRIREQVNPGHGRMKIVEPIAREYRLSAVF